MISFQWTNNYILLTRSLSAISFLLEEDRALSILQYTCISSIDNLWPLFKCLSILAVLKPHCGTGHVLMCRKEFAILKSSRYILLEDSEYRCFYLKCQGICTTDDSHTGHISLPRGFLFPVKVGSDCALALGSDVTCKQKQKCFLFICTA